MGRLRRLTTAKSDSASAQPHEATWSRLGPLFGGRRRWVAALAIGSVLAGVSESGLLAVIAQSAASLVEGGSRVHVDLGPVNVSAGIGVLLGIALGLVLVRFVLQGLVAYVQARVSTDMQTQLRSTLFASFTRASWDVQSRDREGQLQEFATNQIGQSILGARQAAALVVALTTFVVLVLSALAFNAPAALIVLVSTGALFAMLRPLSSIGSRQGRAVSRASSEYARGINEAVQLAEETHVFGVGEAQRGRIDGLIAALLKPYFDMQVLGNVVPAIYQSLIYLLVVVALAILYASGSGQVTSLGAVILLLVRASAYGQQAQGAYQSVRQSLPYLERVQEAQRRYDTNVLRTGTQPLKAVRTLAFENVSFAYEADRPVLSEMSFEVGVETIGIVGPTGAGKSTVVQILLGLRLPTSGRYLVNGLPAQEFDGDDWHRAVAHLSQKPNLLHASVADNIRFFRSLESAEVERAARLAGIHEDIVGWSAGYDTIVGPRADAISGGQQQRICLARALATRPEVLVLDEPTSALDPHTERLIQDSLAGIKEDLTLFVIAHRMSTLDICDRVMVIIDGRLEAFDTASALHVNSSYFRTASGLTAAASPAASETPHGGG